MSDIWLDMDGTFVDLYGVENWLENLQNHLARPYQEAKGLVPLNQLAKILNQLAAIGFTINIVSWLAKASTSQFDEEVTLAKKKWLAKHLPSVKFSRVEILSYGTPKSSVGTGILFDDEERNREEWQGIAYPETALLQELKRLAQKS